ncbi:DNA N-6-adenine-methyltransferase [Parvibaculum sp.]|uniref:DNA N-6-adenine-methyltransferase n=1 Tax=Parvibaculum sp. TaxID=2024848 RepID=UPI002735FDEC|nr:DNA N-6-adenine-methyltransferase [Parvibaculum sp.]MDP3328750.1 DNA N-6-adenine-methyltransferase [Parvibaculum sp.]
MTGDLGMGGHQSANAYTDEWLTPPEIVTALGHFDLDPCSPIVRPWPTVGRHYTVEDNGLMLPWFGRVWLNPPYGSQTGRWLARLVTHGTGTAMIFARTDTAFFFKHVFEEASALLFLRGRVHFHHVDGRLAKDNCGAPSVLVAYGAGDAERLACSGMDGKFVPLRLPRFFAITAAAADQSWCQAILEVLNGRPGPVALDELYSAMSTHPKSAKNRHWREKIRQTLQQGPFRRVRNGVWEAAA